MTPMNVPKLLSLVEKPGETWVGGYGFYSLVPKLLELVEKPGEYCV